MTKKRISLTLEEELVERIDAESDELGLNRSEAVEKIAHRYFKNSEIRTGVIFCGDIDKCLQEENGTSFLRSNLEFLGSHVEELYILCGGNKQRVKHEVDREFSGSDINLVEDPGSGTAAALDKISDSINTTFVAVNGHVDADVNIQNMRSFHEENGRCATVCLTPVNYPSKYGIVSLRGNKISEFEHQASPEEESSKLVNAGVYILSPEIFNQLGSDSLDQVFNKLAREDELTGYVFGGDWIVADGT